MVRPFQNMIQGATSGALWAAGAGLMLFGLSSGWADAVVSLEMQQRLEAVAAVKASTSLDISTAQVLATSSKTAVLGDLMAFIMGCLLAYFALCVWNYKLPQPTEQR